MNTAGKTRNYRTVTTRNRRNADLAKIHIAKKDLCLDDDTYREMLYNITGKQSAADLTHAERQDVITHLKSISWKRSFPGRPKNMDSRTSRAAQLAKIEALLTVGGKSWAYADGIAKRICKTDKVAWVRTDAMYKIITALVKQGKREGWDLKE